MDISAFMDACKESVPCTLVWTGVTHIDVPMHAPWGPSASINSQRRETPGSYRIEMQSGDTIRIDAATASFECLAATACTMLRAMTPIERLQIGEGDRWRRIRLQALQEAPYAFSTKYADAVQWDAARWEAQVAELATFVAVVEGEDVGVARGAPGRLGGVRELISMWVAPTARGQGIGAQLIDSVVAWAKADGATALELEVVASNTAAITLYERNGFLPLEEQPARERPPNEIRFVRSLVT